MEQKHLKEYVAYYHKNGNLFGMYEHIKTYCLIKGYIDMEVMADWDTVDYTLTNTGEAWLYHAPETVTTTEDGTALVAKHAAISQPEPADTGTGYRVEHDARLGKWYVMSGAGVLHIANTETIATFVAQLLSDETSALQSQLAAARERVAELEIGIGDMSEKVKYADEMVHRDHYDHVSRKLMQQAINIADSLLEG